MKKRIVIALAVSIISFTGNCLAVESLPDPNNQAKNFEQHKTKVLMHIDQRMERLRQEKDCIQAARTHADVKACKDKFRPPKEKDRKNIQKDE